MDEKISIKKDESLNLNINEDEQFKESTINTFKNNMVDGLQENKEITGEKQINLQEDLAEKISSDFAVVKKEALTQPEGGSVPEEPKPIMIEKKVEALKSQDEKTYDSIVKAWEKYNEDVENGEVGPEDSIERLKRIVSASDSYTSWRFTFFMKASNPKYQRIMHAKEIYKTAKEQLDTQLKAKRSQEDASKLVEKNDGIKYIHTNNATDALTSFNKVGIFKKAFSVITGTFHWAAANIGSLLTSPFKKKESLKNRKNGYATLGDYWEAHANFYNRVFGESKIHDDEVDGKIRISSSYASRKTRENSENMEEDYRLATEEIGVTDIILVNEQENAQDDYDTAYKLAENINNELKKKSPDMAQIKKWRKLLSSKKDGLLKYNNSQARQENPELKISEEDMNDLFALEYEGQKQEILRLDVFERKIPIDKIYQEEGLAWSELVATEKRTIMSEKWVKKEWIKKGKMPADVVEKKIKEAYRYTHGEDSEIPKDELKKRKEEFQKKFDEAIYADKCLRIYWYNNVDRGGMNDSANIEKMHENGLEHFIRDLKGFMLMEPDEETREKDFHEFIYGHDLISNDGITDEEQRKENDRKNTESKAARLGILKKYVDKYLNFKPEDLKKYEYSTREELLTIFAVYSEELQSGMTAGATLSNYYNYGGTLTEQEEVKFRMVQLFLEEVKNKAEQEIKIMMNPNDLFLDTAYLDTLNWGQLHELREKPGEDDSGENAAGETYDFYWNYREAKTVTKSPYDGMDCIKMFESYRQKALAEAQKHRKKENK